MDDIDRLNAEISETRKAFLARKAELEKLAKPHGATEAFTAQVLESLEEFGAEETLNLVAEYPGRFHLPDRVDSRALASQIGEVTERLFDNNLQLDILTWKREELCAARDPNHRRRLQHQGREFTLDVEAGKLNYEDEPGVSRDLAIEEIIPQMDRTRERMRRRDRSL